MNWTVSDSGPRWPGLVSASFCFLAAAALLLSLFGSLLPSGSGGYSVQRLGLCVVLAFYVICGVGISTLVPGFFWQQRWPIILISSVGLTLIGHGAISENQYEWVEPGLYLGFLFSIWITGAILGRFAAIHSYVEPLVILVGIGVALYASMSIIYFLFWTADPQGKLSEYLPWGFVNIRYWSQLATWLIPLLPIALIAVQPAKFKLWKFGIIFGGGVWVWLLLVSSARGSLLSLALGALAALIVFRRDSFPWLKQLFLLALMGCLLWGSLSLLVPMLLGAESGGRALVTHSSGRLVLWHEAFAMSMQNVPFGMGPQSWLLHKPLTEGYQSSKAFGHPHNMYLMWAAEYGWLIVLLITLLILGTVRRVFRFQNALRGINDRKQSFILCGFFGSVVAAFSHATVSSLFIVPSSMLAGFFVVTTLWALLQRRIENSRHFNVEMSVRRIWVAVALSLFFAIVSTAWLLEVFRYYQAMQEDVQFYIEESRDGFFPRFWYHGYFPRPDSP